MRVGKVQLHLLGSLVRFKNWRDVPMPGWVMGSRNATRKILQALVKKGLVRKGKKTMWQDQKHDTYVITKAGIERLAERKEKA